MRVIIARCAGLDIHQKTVSSGVSFCEPSGRKRQEVRVFEGFTANLWLLVDWLREQGVTHASMEAIGVDWRPVWAVPVGPIGQLLVNLPHSKFHTKHLSGSEGLDRSHTSRFYLPDKNPHCLCSRRTVTGPISPEGNSGESA